MATELQKFRRRHPEFSELSDFEIADGLRERFAQETDEPVLIRPFFEAIGGPELLTELPPSGEAQPTPPPQPQAPGEDARRALEPAPAPSSALEGELGRLDRPDGKQSTEISITVTDPRLNAGRPTNIPSLVRGQEDVEALLGGAFPSERQQGIAIERAAARVKGGAELPSFGSIPEAETAAAARSEAKPRGQPTPPSTEGLTGLELPGEPGTPAAQLTGENLEAGIRGGQALEAIAKFARGGDRPDERVTRRAFRKKEAVAERTREILGDAEKETAKQASDRREAFREGALAPDQPLGQIVGVTMNLIPMTLALFAAQHTDDPEIIKDVLEAFGPLDQTPGEATERRVRSIASGAAGAAGGIIGFLGTKSNIDALQSGALTAQGIAEGLMPRDPAFIEEVGSGFGSSAVFWVPGVGIARGAEAIAKTSHVAALWAGAGASGVMEAMAEAGNTFQSLVDQGIKPEEAERRADEVFFQNAAVVTLFNRFGLFGEQSTQFARTTLTAAAEGVQEFFQQIIGNLAETDPLLQGAGKATAIGAIVGGAAASATPGGVLPTDGQGPPGPTPLAEFPKGGPGFTPPAAPPPGAPPPPTAEEQAGIDADQPTAPPPAPPGDGKLRTSFTPRNEPIETEFAVVEADTLITSNDDQGNINPTFPAELQPRDRSRKASGVQIAKIAGNINPELLAESQTVTEGAPIVGDDLVVESGNARVIAIRQALADERGTAYRQFLTENAARFGLTPQEIDRVGDPVLVRIRRTDVADRAEFARQANQPAVAGLAPAEQARSDAARLTEEDLSLFNPDQGGNPLAASNEQFIRTFIQRIGAEEAAGFTDEAGRPTKQLADRINSAIFARVYGDDRLIALQAEAADPQIKNILSALQAAAPAFAKAKAIDENLAGLNIPEKITDAVEMIREQQRRGGTIEQLLDQTDLFGERDAEAVGFARFIAQNIRSAERMGRAFSTIAEFLEAEVGRQQTEDIFGDEPASLADLLVAANREIEKSNAAEDQAAGGTIPDLFGAAPTRLPPAGAPQPTPAPGAAPGQPPGERGAPAPTAPPTAAPGPAPQIRGTRTQGGEQVLALNALELRVIDKAFDELELLEAVVDAISIEVEEQPGTTDQTGAVAVSGEVIAPTDELTREELREGLNDIADAIRAGTLAPDFAATDLAAAKAMEDLAAAITEGAAEEAVEEQAELTDDELDDIIEALAGIQEGRIDSVKREIARNAKATELAAIITEGSPGLNVRRRETEGSVSVFAQGKDVVIRFGPEQSTRLTPGKIGKRLAAIFGAAPAAAAAAPAAPVAAPDDAALDKLINQAFPEGSEGRTNLVKAVTETTNPLSLANLATAFAPEVTFGVPSRVLGEGVQRVFGAAPESEDRLVFEERRLREAETALRVLEKAKPRDKKAVQIARSRVRDSQAAVRGIVEARERAQADQRINLAAGSTMDLTGIKKSRIKLASKAHPGLVWVRFGDDTSATRVLAEPDPTTNVHRSTGFLIEHAGHPTANFPFTILTPTGERVVTESGRGFAKLGPAEAKVLRLFNQRLERQAEGEVDAEQEQGPRAPDADVQPTGREDEGEGAPGEVPADVGGPGVRPVGQPSEGPRTKTVVVAAFNDAQARISKLLRDSSMEQKEREEKAAAVTVELRGLQVELAQIALDEAGRVTPGIASDRKRNAKVSAALRKTADGMQKQIDAKLDPATAGQNLTPRRARIIDSMMADGRRLQSIQTDLNNMADATDQGSLPLILANVKSRAIVEDLLRVNLPSGKLAEKEVKRAENAGLRTQEKWEQARAALKSLATAGPTTDPIVEARRNFERLKRDLVGLKGVGVDFFPTPPELAADLVDRADAQVGDSVLEPSAGSGNIIEAMAEIYETFDIPVTALERSARLVEVLEAQADALAKKHEVTVRSGDFLEYTTPHDVIVMNPPFSKNQDIAHVRHAWELLKPGGRLVAVMSEHAFIASGKVERDFRDFLSENNGEADELDPGELADRAVTQRSNVKGRVVEMNKPVGGDVLTGPGIVSEGGTTFTIAEPGPDDATDAEQLDLFAPAGKPKPKAPTVATATVPATGRPRIRQVRTGTMHSSIDTVSSIADAVHVIAPHRKDAQESFIALVTDSAGKIIRIVRHSIGSVAGANVAVPTILGEVAERTVATDMGILSGSVSETPGAQRVYFAHNHPSGIPTQSGADRTMTERLAERLKGTGVQMMAGIVVAPGSRTAGVLPVDVDGTVMGEIQVQIPAGRRNIPIPVTERRIRKVSRDVPGESISSPSASVAALEKNATTPNGVMLIDNRNRALQWIPMSVDEMRKLRTGDIETGASKLARSIVQQNAAAAIIKTEGSTDSNLSNLRNVGTFLHENAVRVLDAFVSESDGTLTSIASKGLPMTRGAARTFSMERVPPGTDIEADTDPEESSLELVRRTIIDAGGTVMITQDMDGDLSLDLVELPRKAQGAGVGTRFMAQLVVHADRYGRTIVLVPQKPGDFTPRGVNVRTTAKERLENFYRKFGFSFDSTRTVMFRTSASTPAPTGDTLPPGTQEAGPGATFRNLLNESQLPEPAPGAPKKPVSGFGVFKTPIAPDKPLRRDKILRNVERDFGIKIYQGRVKGGKSRLGFYRSHIEELRIKHNNELEVVAHELGHFLDDTDPRFSFAYNLPAFKNEVLGLSYDVDKLDEGFAEFLRLFLTQEEEAIARAPAFYEEFVSLIGGSKFETGLVRAQADMHAWFRQGALNRALSKIGTDTTFSGRVQDLWFALQETADKFDDRAIENTLDELQGVKMLERTVTGGIGDADLSPYKVMRLIRGVRGVVRAVFKHGTIGLQINGDIVFTGPGLRQVFEPVANVMDETMSYFAGRRGIELASQGRENLLSVRELEELVAQGSGNPKIVKAFDDYQAFLNRMMDFYEESGIVSSQSRAIIQELNKSYVPFHRIQELATGEKRFINRAAFKRLIGGTANVNDIYNNIMQSTAALIDLSVQNTAKQKVYGLVKRGRGAAKFATRIPRDTKVVKIDSAQVAAKIEGILDEMGVVLSDGTPLAGMQSTSGGTMFSNEVERHFGDFMKFFTFGNAPIGDNVDSVMFNGRREYFEIADPMLLRAMLSFGWRPTNLIIRVMQGFKRTLTFGVTALPDFFIPNLTRDSVSGWLLRRSNMLPVVSSIRGLWDRLQKSDDYWLFLANGGGFASSVRTETATTRRELEKLYVKSGFTLKNVVDTPAKLVDFWLEVGSAFEYGTRLAEFKSSVKQGKSLQEAAFRGREVSTDFAMRGAGDFIRNFIATVPFLNARMQGLYRLERELFETGGKQTPRGENQGQLMARGFIGLVLPSIALWWINQDDDRYNALPDWIRDLHWVIFIPGREAPVLIAKPFELGAIFGTIPERTMEFIKTRDGKEFSDALAFVALEQLNAAAVPQIFSPMLDHAMNRNFTGGRVIPDDLMKVEASEQFRPWSSETAIFLGEKLGMSPLLYDHYVRGYLGTLGMYLTMASDGLVNAQLPDGPAKEWSDRPIIRRFTRSLPLRRTSYEDEFYELRQEVRLVTNTFNKIKNEARDPSDYITSEGRAALFGLRFTVDSISREAGRINRALRQNRLDPTKGVAEKTRDRKSLTRERNQLFKDAADALSPATVRKLRDRLEEER